MANLPDRPKQSNFKTTLAVPLDSSQTTGIILNAVPDYSSGGETTIFTVLNPKGVEHISATGWNSSTKTLTGVTRGVIGYTGGSSTARAHGGGLQVILGNPWQLYDDVNTSLDSKVDVAGDTMTGRLQFSGTNGTVKVRAFADTTARDAAMTSPSDGDMCVVAGDLQHYNGTTAQWETADTGTPTPNGADGTGGKVDIASATEIGAGTATDGTSGAINVIPVSQTVKTSSGAGDENKLPVLNGSGKLAIGFIPTVTDDTKIANSLVEAKGDLIVATADDTPARRAVGADGTVLTAASGDTTGTDWLMPTKKINLTTTDVTVTGTTSETNLFQTSIPANLLGTNNLVKVVLNVSDVDLGVDTYTIAIKFYYGSTVLGSADIKPDTSNTIVNGRGIIECTLMAAGTTATQDGVLLVDISEDSAGATVNREHTLRRAFGTATEDSTGALNLTVTATPNNSGNNITVANAYAQLIA